MKTSYMELRTLKETKDPLAAREHRDQTEAELPTVWKDIKIHEEKIPTAPAYVAAEPERVLDWEEYST
eukprot:1668895-Lingulodinium_polyedra.AAC.1